MEGRQVIRKDSCPLSCNGEEVTEMRKGPWTDDEDAILAGYVAAHGEGRWNTTARFAGLKRTGKSCRLRWLNYLRPNVRRGSITLQEQLLILQLHSRWGNRWSKIAQYLPGRTDNEIKNYWRTRVQKLAKRLKCDVNSEQFRDSIHQVWIPRLIELIQAADSGSSAGQSSRSADCCMNRNSNYQDDNIDHILATEAFHHVNESGCEGFDSNLMPELSGSPSDSLDSRVLLDYTDSDNPSWGYSFGGGLSGSGLRPGDDGAFCGWHCQSSSYRKWYGVQDVEAFESEPQRNGLMGGGDGSFESLWIDEKILFLSRS